MLCLSFTTLNCPGFSPLNLLCALRSFSMHTLNKHYTSRVSYHSSMQFHALSNLSPSGNSKVTRCFWKRRAETFSREIKLSILCLLATSMSSWHYLKCCQFYPVPLLGWEADFWDATWKNAADQWIVSNTEHVRAERGSCDQ